MKKSNLCKVRDTRLENGLTVLTDRMDDVRSATLSFIYRIGARDESAEWHGISHFIEHAVFKGTTRRSTRDIAVEQDRLGGNLDAFTTHEETGFAIKVLDEKLDRAFDLIGDMLCEPRFLEDDLVSEQNVIIEEMKMTDDSPEDLLSDIFNAEFFRESSLARTITGTQETVRSFDSKRTRDYFEQAFTPENLVIAAAGNVVHEHLVELAAKTFDLTPRPPATPKAAESPKPSSPFVVRHRSDLEQAHLIIATPFPSARDDERYAADLLANIIGGGTSSRIWQTIREGRGLAYNVGASTTMYRDCGVFAIFAATSPAQAREVVELSIAELSQIVREGVTPDELELAKDTARASILLSLEDSAARSASAAQIEIIHGRQISVEETIARIDRVSLDDIFELAVRSFRPEALSFVALGDLKRSEFTREAVLDGFAA
ncbi:MAG: peptidase M16 domain-containing protein [Acidobacteria bacterium OLB17]|nr:MAG: peptidase M16 domain-containing protein [Acidobacteria bacterium OLB17]MCZ2390870.1 insulinase family protein [Acidobacteriota bacterium]